MVDEVTGKAPDPSAQDGSAVDGGSAALRDSILCEVFRSPRREGMYLYVKRGEGLKRVPAALLQRFGTPRSALVFRLDSERRLARAAATDVLKALTQQGFYLQMPPLPGADAGDAAVSADREDPPC